MFELLQYIEEWSTAHPQYALVGPQPNRNSGDIQSHYTKSITPKLKHADADANFTDRKNHNYVKSVRESERVEKLVLMNINQLQGAEYLPPQFFFADEGFWNEMHRIRAIRTTENQKTPEAAAVQYAFFQFEDFGFCANVGRKKCALIIPLVLEEITEWESTNQTDKQKGPKKKNLQKDLYTARAANLKLSTQQFIETVRYPHRIHHVDAHPVCSFGSCQIRPRPRIMSLRTRK